MRDIRIGLLWHALRATNLGVGALTAGNMALARRAAASAGLTPRFTVFGPRETGPVSIDADDVAERVIDGRYMVSPGGFAADARAMDVMLDISAGDSFTDIYPAKRFAYMAATKIVTILAGTPLVLSPQTIGPFSKAPQTAAARWIVRRSAAVFARDPLSMQRLATLAPAVTGRQVVDVAFALPFTRPDWPRDRLRVGINVSGLLMNGGYAGGNEYGLGFDYPALTRALITGFAGMAGVEVHLVPHVIAPHLPNDDDGGACDRLATEFPGVVRAPDFPTASAAKSYISGLDFLVGARMHATIAAWSAGVPVVPVSYSPKFEGLFGGLGYDWLVPARGMTTEAATAHVLSAFEQRARLAADIAAARPQVEAGLDAYVTQLAALFAGAAAA